MCVGDVDVDNTTPKQGENFGGEGFSWGEMGGWTGKGEPLRLSRFTLSGCNPKCPQQYKKGRTFGNKDQYANSEGRGGWRLPEEKRVEVGLFCKRKHDSKKKLRRTAAGSQGGIPEIEIHCSE